MRSGLFNPVVSIFRNCANFIKVLRDNSFNLTISFKFSYEMGPFLIKSDILTFLIR